LAFRFRFSDVSALIRAWSGDFRIGRVQAAHVRDLRLGLR
jgi:hypothetical protein